jgi:hypothetical protein
MLEQQQWVDLNEVSLEDVLEEGEIQIGYGDV